MIIQDSLRKSIQETETLIEMVRRQFTELGLPSYLADSQINSYRVRIQQLEQQLREIEGVAGKEQITLVMHPPGMESGQISVRAFTAIVGGLQSVADSVANTLFNQPSLRGLIPSEILERNTLIMSAQKAGSYHVTLEVPHHEKQTSFETPEETNTISEVFSLFESSDSPEKLFETISNLGPRTLKHYVDWMKAIEETNTPIEIEWASPIKGKSNIGFNPEKANRVFTTLSNFKEGPEETITATGILEGANIRTKSFEITTIEGDTVAGRVGRPEALEALKTIVLGSNVEASLIKTSTINLTTGSERIKWSLIRINKK